MNKKKRVLFVAGILLVLIVGWGTWRAVSESPAEAGPGPATREPPLVVTVAVQPQPLDDIVILNGGLSGAESVTLRSEVSARITGIHFEEGTWVEEGQRLVSFDDRELVAQRQALEARLRLAREVGARRQEMLSMGLVPQEEFDEIANQAQVLEAELELVAAQLSKRRIAAPFAGVIGLRLVSPGEYVSQAAPIAQMEMVDPLKLTFGLPEVHQHVLRKGLEVVCRVAGRTAPRIATVYAWDSRLDEVSRTIQVRARLDNAGQELIPGSFATVELPVQTFASTIIVPSVSLMRNESGGSVWVVENGKAIERSVKTGIRTETGVQVLEGLEPGDEVIYRGIQNVRNGQDVRVRREEALAQAVQ